MGNAVETGENRNPPIDYVVAAWLGMPDREVARGLQEGWIRAPAGVDARRWAEQRGFSGGEHLGDVAGVAVGVVLLVFVGETTRIPSGIAHPTLVRRG